MAFLNGFPTDPHSYIFAEDDGPDKLLASIIRLYKGLRKYKWVEGTYYAGTSRLVACSAAAV